MPATITWVIEQMERQTLDGGVVTAHWRCNGEDDGFFATVYGSVGFMPDPTSPTFKPYEELTEVDVRDWVWGKLDKTEIEAALAAGLEDQKTPPVVYGTPW
jgi:hypothetical protein